MQPSVGSDLSELKQIDNLFFSQRKMSHNESENAQEFRKGGNSKATISTRYQNREVTAATSQMGQTNKDFNLLSNSSMNNLGQTEKSKRIPSANLHPSSKTAM